MDPAHSIITHVLSNNMELQQLTPKQPLHTWERGPLHFYWRNLLYSSSRQSVVLIAELESQITQVNILSLFICITLTPLWIQYKTHANKIKMHEWVHEKKGSFAQYDRVLLPCRAASMFLVAWRMGHICWLTILDFRCIGHVYRANASPDLHIHQGRYSYTFRQPSTLIWRVYSIYCGIFRVVLQVSASWTEIIPCNCGVYWWKPMCQRIASLTGVVRTQWRWRRLKIQTF